MRLHDIVYIMFLQVLPNLRKVGLRLLATLGFLHQQDMIHTDLKPENILLKYGIILCLHIMNEYLHFQISCYKSLDFCNLLKHHELLKNDYRLTNLTLLQTEKL